MRDHKRTARTRSGAEVRQAKAPVGVWKIVARVAALVLVCVAGVGAGYVGVYVRRGLETGELLDIRRIVPTGQQLVDAGEIVTYSGLGLGTGLYAFDPELVERLVEAHPLVAEARVVRRPPHELRIFVVEHRPVAYVDLGRLYAVNAQGEIFARAEALGGLDLPLVTGFGPNAVETGTVESRRVLQTALRILGDLATAGHRPDALVAIHVDPAIGVTLAMRGRLGRVHLGREDYRVKLEQLAILERALAERGESAADICMSDGGDRRRVVVTPRAVEGAGAREAAPGGQPS